MELTQANLLKKFGESAELCAGSISAVVDGKKVQVATMDVGSGEYSLTEAGSIVVYGQVLSATAPLAETPSTPSTKKRRGVTPAQAPTPPASIESPDLPDLEPVDPILTGLEGLDEALAGIEADE
jgi:hypothetical protein